MNSFFVRYPDFIYTASRWMLLGVLIYPLIVLVIVPAVVDAKNVEEIVSFVQILLTLLFLIGFGILEFMVVGTVKKIFREAKKMWTERSSGQLDSPQYRAVNHTLKTAWFLHIFLTSQCIMACIGFIFFLAIGTRFQYIVFNLVSLNPYSEAIIIPLLTLFRTEGGLSPIRTNQVKNQVSM